MNYGPLIFLAAFFALSSSWVGLVLTPQMQVGQIQTTNGLPAGATYPLGRPGLAREGLDVYRASGCAYCHSQQVGQTGTDCEVELTQAGTNQAALLTALVQVRPGLSETQAKALLASLPKTVLRAASKQVADDAVKTLTGAGAKAQTWIVPAGADIARGWGKRRTVAQDFLFDDPVMPGWLRVGPDLANVGARLPDANWHLRHLYAPQLVVPKSPMPPYRYLFEKRKIEQARSAEALDLPAGLGPGAGYEIIPRREARALAAYLLSLRADTPLFEAPFTVASLASPASKTNAAAGTNAAPTISGTNSAPTNASSTNSASTNSASTNTPPR